jgi:translation initiation factor RLI1
LGLVGTNGIGKSTALKVLAGKLKPNLGRFLVQPSPVALSGIKSYKYQQLVH